MAFFLSVSFRFRWPNRQHGRHGASSYKWFIRCDRFNWHNTMPNINIFHPFAHSCLSFNTLVFSFSPHSIGSGDIESLPKVWDISVLFWKIFKLWRTFLWNSVWLLSSNFNFFHIHQSSPGNLSMNNQPGTPRDDGEMSGNFLNPFQSESVCMQKDVSMGSLKYSSSCHFKYLLVFLQYSPNMTMSVWEDSTGVKLHVFTTLID